MIFLSSSRLCSRPFHDHLLTGIRTKKRYNPGKLALHERFAEEMKEAGKCWILLTVSQKAIKL